MKLRADIKNLAKEKFSGQYWLGVGAFVIFGIITGLVSETGIGALFVTPPMIVGYSAYCLKVYRGVEGDIGGIFADGFTDYWRNVGGILWMYLFTFLWFLLFIVPGIIKSLAYFMTPYILADSKNVAPTQALKLSMRMTKGYKGRIFVMYLSFIGWGLLTALTFGILAIFWTGPYMNTSLAGLYDELKQNAINNGVVAAEELA